MVIGGKIRLKVVEMMLAVGVAGPPITFVSAFVVVICPVCGGAVANRLGDKSLGRLLIEETLIISGT